MPRTKVPKKPTNKRNRNSTADDLRTNAMSDVDKGTDLSIIFFYDTSKTELQMDIAFDIIVWLDLV